MSFNMSVCLTENISAFPTRRIDVKFYLRAFMKICRENTKIDKNRTKRALYMQIKLCIIVAGNIKSPQKSYLRMKLYQSVRMAVEA
jgi:hypothetical protein